MDKIFCKIYTLPPVQVLIKKGFDFDKSLPVFEIFVGFEGETYLSQYAGKDRDDLIYVKKRFDDFTAQDAINYAQARLPKLKEIWAQDKS